MRNCDSNIKSCALRTRDKGGRGHKLEIRSDNIIMLWPQ